MHFATLGFINLMYEVTIILSCMHHAACTCTSFVLVSPGSSWSGATSGNSAVNDQADNEIHWCRWPDYNHIHSV